MRFQLQLDPSRVPDGPVPQGAPGGPPADTVAGSAPAHATPPPPLSLPWLPASVSGPPSNGAARVPVGHRRAEPPLGPLPVLSTDVAHVAPTARGMPTLPDRLGREPSDSPSDAVAWYELPTGLTGQLLVVPPGARVKGDCEAPSVWVLGEVQGRVVATHGVLVIGAGGRVQGGIEGHGPVVVAGEVASARGRPAVVAWGRLDLACSAHVTGDVRHGVVAVYDGARVHGVLLPVKAAAPGR